MKTLEFKIYPNLAQSQTIDKWLDNLRWVWNRGLSLKLAAKQQYFRTLTEDRTIPEGLLLKWKWRKVEVADKKGKDTEKWEKIRLVGSGIVRPKNGHPFCPIREHRDIENPDKYSQCEFFRSDRTPEFISDIPSKLKAGVADTLKKAWKAYGDPKRPTQKPKFKGKRDKIRSLINLNAGGLSGDLKPQRILGSDNGYVQFPKLGKLRVKGLFARCGWQKWGAASIVKEPSGYYLHVCVDIAPEVPSPSDKPVGIDPGLKSVISTDGGHQIDPPRLYRDQQAKLRRLQRKASRQIKGSQNQKKTYKRIAKLHENIRRSRNAFNHKVSTKLVREFGAIVWEDIQVTNLNRKPKSKAREDGNGYEQNGASRKAGLNKSFADSALGDLRVKIETKCKAGEREFVKVAPHYTTVDCSNCGAKIKKSLSTRTHRCTSCGFVEDRDVNAARNILIKGRKSLDGTYRAWAWERGKTPKPDSASNTEGRQEGVKAPPSPEHGDQLPNHLRQPVGVKSTSEAKSTSKPCNSAIPDDSQAPEVAAPCVPKFPAINTKTTRRKSKKNIRLPESAPQTVVQLTIWDVIVASHFEGVE